MSSSSCFVCSAELQGDEAYVQHHINRCLDQGLEQSSAPSGALEKSAGDGRAASKSSTVTNGASKGAWATASNTTSSDAALARLIAEEADAEAARAVSQADSLFANEAGASDEWDDVHAAMTSSSSSAAVGAECPLCGATWDALGVGSAQEREAHAASCLDGDGWEDEGDENESERRGRIGFGKSLGGKGKSRPPPSFDWAGAGRGQDAVKGTAGLLRVIQALLSRSQSAGRSQLALLASERVEHISGGWADIGWSCGYRNAQMLFSSLRHLEAYSHLNDPSLDLPPIPTIKELQNIIEIAWNSGYDPPGAAHFKGKVVGSKKWIGTTEIYTAFVSLGIRANIVDFPKEPGKDGQHKALIDWIHKYFATPLPSSPNGLKRPLTATDGQPTNAFATLLASKGSPVKMTSRQPLYLQHQGHSRTVVGVEQDKNGEWLLLYDPGKQVSMNLSKAATASRSPVSSRTTSLHPAPKRPHPSSSSSSSDSTSNALGLSTSATAKGESAFWQQTPGFEQIWHGKSTAGGSKQEAQPFAGLDLNLHSKMLEPYRVKLKSLSRHDEYQIIYVEEGPILSQAERNVRKKVTSQRVTSK